MPTRTPVRGSFDWHLANQGPLVGSTVVSELRDRRHVEAESVVEVALPAGDVTWGVVRVGGTVRRPHHAQSYAVAAYLDHLARVGFEASPRFLGRDDAVRDVFTFLEGDVAGIALAPWVLEDSLLASVARRVHRLHEASTDYDPIREPFPARTGAPEKAELVTHLD